VRVDEEIIYLDKEEENSNSEKEEDLNSCSEFEEEPLLIGNDPLPDHVNVDYDNKNPPMIVGSTYDNMEEFKLALAQHAIKNEFEYKREKSDPGRYRAYCLTKREDECPWRIHACTLGDGVTVKVMTWFTYDFLRFVSALNCYISFVQVKKNPTAHDCTSTRRAKKVKNATKH
jgi:hypothetical protein